MKGTICLEAEGARVENLVAFVRIPSFTGLAAEELP
jgi:hypothetical protein